MPVVVQSMYIFKVSALSSSGLSLSSVKWAQCLPAPPYKGHKLSPQRITTQWAREHGNWFPLVRISGTSLVLSYNLAAEWKGPQGLPPPFVGY